MSRASVFLVLFGLTAFAACYYDGSTPELPPADTPGYVSPMAAYELAQQPIKFKFKAEDAVDDTTTSDAADASETATCEAKDCTSGWVCHPTANTCVPCYLDGTTTVNCGTGEECVEDAADPTQNVCW
jgi:hypothetical protein